MSIKSTDGPIYTEDTFALINHDRTTQYKEGDCVLVGNGQIFEIISCTANIITVDDNQGTKFRLQLIGDSNIDLFKKYIATKWDASKEYLQKNEDYPDYQPGLYLTLEAFRNKHITIYTGNNVFK